MKQRRVLAVAVPVCIGLALTAGPTYAGATATKSTTFAFGSSGFGTRVIGGQVPAGSSSTTAYQHIGCTNRAGRSRTNNIAEASVPGLGTVSDARTHLWTTSRNGVVASHSTHSIGRIVLAQSQLGTLAIDAITSHVRAYHDAQGFHAVATTRVGEITYTPPTGPAQSLPAPTPDQPVAVPGLATIYVGRHRTHDSATSAGANAFALRVDVVASGNSVRVARSHAELHAGLTGGIFGGRTAATHVVRAGGDIAKSGPNPLTIMPCQGTYGRTHKKTLSSDDLGGRMVVSGASSLVRGAQGLHRAEGVSRAKVNQLNLGGGQLVINGIVGRASVVRTAAGVTTSARGTQLGTIMAGGKQQTFPPTGVLEIPGVAELERAVVTRTPSGISVIGLRITLLDGSGAVIDLAEAKLGIRPLS